ncbi:MAG: ABC transporter permease [Vulcanimicrobiaceae bacterium]
MVVDELKAPVQAQRARPSFGRFQRVADLTLLALLLGIWQLISAVILPRTNPTAVTLMPAPTVVLATATHLMSTGELEWQAFASLKREIVAFILAAALAIPLGIAMGWWRGVRRQMVPVTELVRPVPPLAWIPLGILWFGIGDLENVFIIFVAIFFPVLINTIAGVRSVDLYLIRAARALGANESAILRRVVLNAALPQIFTGLRVGFGVGWMALVAAEITGAQSGLGFLMWDSRSFLRTDVIITCMLTIGVLGLAIDLFLQKLMRLAIPWRREAR